MGGLDAKVMEELKLHKGKDSYEDCVKGVTVGINGIHTAYSLKGNDVYDTILPIAGDLV